MNVAQLWSLDANIVVVGQWDEASVFLAGLDVAEAYHVDLQRWAADGQKPVSQIALLFGLAVTRDALLHAFGNAMLDDWKSEADLLLGNDSADCVLPDFVLAEGVRGDDVGDVGDVAVFELIVAGLDSEMWAFDA